MELEKLKSMVESLLFAVGEPLKISKIAKAAGAEKAEVENAIMALSAEYNSQKRGIVILQKGEEVQMGTAPENAEIVRKMVRSQMQEDLTPAALEVISIVAYRGPITRADIEAIRGVNSSYTLRNLLLRGLIDRRENPRDARSYVYEITFDFLKHLGLDNIKKLPDYEKLGADERVKFITGSVTYDKSLDNSPNEKELQ